MAVLRQLHETRRVAVQRLAEINFIAFLYPDPTVYWQYYEIRFNCHSYVYMYI